MLVKMTDDCLENIRGVAALPGTLGDTGQKRVSDVAIWATSGLAFKFVRVQTSESLQCRMASFPVRRMSERDL